MFFVIPFLILFPVLALAQDLPPDLGSNQEAIAGILAMLGGFGTAKGLALVALIVQAVMLLARAPLSSFMGKWKIVVVAALNLVGAWLVLKVQSPEMPLLDSLIHGSVLTAVQVFGHQLWKQFTEKAA